MFPLLKSNQQLVRQHGTQSVLIGFVGDDTLFQLAFAGARLRRQDVASRGMMAHDFAGPGLLETFRRTLMGLHLGHILSWEFVRVATESPEMNYFQECNTEAQRSENAALPLQGANAANVSHGEGKQILVVVANEVIDAANL